MIATGGTIACCETAHGLSPALDSAALLGALPELSALCTVETLDLMQLDSTDVTAADRQRMAQAVWQNREKFDGFVLTHGTDTLAYTAALLTHLLPHFDKPLVLTGSMLPMGCLLYTSKHRGFAADDSRAKISASHSGTPIFLLVKKRRYMLRVFF